MGKTNLNLLTAACTDKCTAEGAVSTDAARDLLKQLQGWKLIEEKGKAPRIQLDLKLRNFKQALDTANRVGELAEAQNHHPEIIIGWGYCNISLYTHTINGLHMNDFIMAAKINELLQGT